MSVLTNEDEITPVDNELELLKEEATDLGIEFSDKIGATTLAKRIEDKKESIKAKQEAKKVAKEAKANEGKVTIVVESRDGDDSITDQFFGFNGQSILIQLGEEVEVTESMYEFIKGIGAKVKKFKLKNDADGVPRKEWYDKFVTRFLVQKVG